MSRAFAPAILLASCSLLAQERRDGARVRLPIEEGADLVFVRVPFGNGSSHTTVTQIASDRSGFLWFGTNDGLKRYDGYRIRDFRPDSRNRSSLSGLSVESVLEDRSGELWVASDLTVDRYDPATERFTHYPSDPSVLEGPIHHINQDRAGMIWLATAHGLTRIDPATGKMTRYLNPMTAVLRSTFEQKEGTFWVAGKESVGVFDRRTGEITQHIPLRDPAAASAGRSANLSVRLFEDRAGVVWVVSERDGLATIDRRNKKLNYFALAPGADPSLEPGVWTIHEDQEGVLWIGTNGGGLLKLDRDRKKFVRYRNDPDDPESLCGDRVLALFEDTEGGIWAGTDGGGVVRFPSGTPPFHRYGQPHSNTDYVSSAYEDRRGNIWVGSKGVVSRIDRQTGRFTTQRLGGERARFANSDVFSIVEDGSGKLWFGAWGTGLHRLDPRTQEWKTYRHTPDDPASLGQDSVFAVLIDHRGRLWVGTENGLNAFDPKTERFQVYRVGALGTNRERAIAEDSHRTLWLATLYTGVHRFDPATGQFTVYRHSEEAGSLSNDAVAAIYVDRSGIVWAGTADGLNRFDPASSKFRAYYQRDGISGSSVTGIQEDERGDLWVTTNNGLSRLDRRTNTFQNYYRSDGVPSDLTSIWKGQNGNMLVGSHTGLISFLADRVMETHHVAPVVLTNFELSDEAARIGGDSPLKQSISFTKNLTLTHKQPILSFEFAALSYASPSQTRYRYRLEGLEAAWNEVDASKRSARYTTLAAGDYVFRVQSRANRGAWSQNGVGLRIRILPPWWETWPFRALCAAAFACLLWAAYRLRVHQMADRLNLRFEERLLERTRIAGELHDTLLQGLLSASMQLDVAADELPSESPVKRQLSHILEVMSHVSAEGRNALQGLRSPEGGSMRLELAFAQIEREFAAEETGSRAELHIAVQGAPQPLHPVFRDEVYRIGREAVINAYRHSGAKTIEVEIEYSGKQFRLVVSDDGCGIDPQVLRAGSQGHWGLRGMRERSERIGGRLRVWSGAEKGTRIEMSVPGNIAFRFSAAARLCAARLQYRKSGAQRFRRAMIGSQFTSTDLTLRFTRARQTRDTTATPISRISAFTRGKAVLMGILTIMSGCSPREEIEPSIEFTTLPPSGEGSPAKLDIIEGRVIGAKRGQQIVLFARSGVWWVQPFEAAPFTAIQSNSTWKSTTHPGNAYAAVLVSPGYRPPPTVRVLPQKGGPILAVATAEGRMLTSTPPKTLHFSGYEWRIRQTAGDPGGSTNMYDPANAWTDDKGFLHIRIAGPPDHWTSGEVSLSHSLGYGSYRFVIRDISHWEPAAIFSISTWDDSGPSREMDIELGRWGEPSSKNAQFVVQPYYVPANTYRFETSPGTIAYSFRWEPGRVTFQADRGGVSGGGSDVVSRHAFTSGVPSPGNETIRLNHYVFANTNNPLRHGSEVIIEKFEYLP